MELCLNGALPYELLILQKHIREAGADFVVVNFSLRSFSKDFDKKSALTSRGWIEDLKTEKSVALNNYQEFIFGVEQLRKNLFEQTFSYWLTEALQNQNLKNGSRARLTTKI